ncbi:MAG: acyl carrier protein [Clostridia bacterium]|nr:acyl carrier protein [Clostridia bacterium]MBP5593375.1 acyl carrier protein [Clostridia bacterium]MBP5648469.1 acyl carrier protein [Clostridia bacterium]
MMFDLIAEKLAEYLKVDKSTITMDTNIKTDLNADSLTIIELLFNLEQELSITIPDEVVDGLETVGSLVNYLESVKK